MPVLYSLPLSGPCRAVLMTADVLGIDLEVKNVDLMKGEHLEPKFVKVNSHHVVPTLVDDGFTLFESRAIMCYLVNKYSPNSSLYPQDTQKRALVDQALYFDASTLYPSMGAVIYPIIKSGAKFDAELAKTLDEKLVLLNEDLGKSAYLAGDQLTIADLSVLATWTTIEAMDLWKTDHLTNIHNWVKRIKDSNQIKNYEELVVTTVKQIGDYLKDKLKGN